MGVDWQMEHLNVPSKTLFSPTGPLAHVASDVEDFVSAVFDLPQFRYVAQFDKLSSTPFDKLYLTSVFSL